ncbi:hypothetical protein ES332_A05G407700v1 [Gossypium tomentosum]|uniref:Uncharacterized protein n=1 Tax=Gossypium tomentosum TaxID=34277 RepID=A0A5D2QQK4_GOSTO|nr:hypothetical protein ES332_A05G407700v1 [Gossypium tomentosum]
MVSQAHQRFGLEPQNQKPASKPDPTNSPGGIDGAHETSHSYGESLVFPGGIPATISGSGEDPDIPIGRSTDQAEAKFMDDLCSLKI